MPLQSARVEANLDDLDTDHGLPGQSVPDCPRRNLTTDPLIPFLWVAALCIIQDSDEDKSRQISNMGPIYSCSKVTLVAVEGKSAHAGLSGISIPCRSSQMFVAIDHSGLGASSSYSRGSIRAHTILLPKGLSGHHVGGFSRNKSSRLGLYISGTDRFSGIARVTTEAKRHIRKRRMRKRRGPRTRASHT